MLVHLQHDKLSAI